MKDEIDKWLQDDMMNYHQQFFVLIMKDRYHSGKTSAWQLYSNVIKEITF